MDYKEKITPELTDKQTTTIFAINCVTGINNASDYKECIAKANNLLAQGKTFPDVEKEIRGFLFSKYP